MQSVFMFVTSAYFWANKYLIWVTGEQQQTVISASEENVLGGYQSGPKLVKYHFTKSLQMPEEQTHSNLFHIWRPISAAGIHMKGMGKPSHINSGNSSMPNYFMIKEKRNPVHNKILITRPFWSVPSWIAQVVSSQLQKLVFWHMIELQ